jgi:SAM-dependent methyltransferase
MAWWVTEFSARELARKVRAHLIPNLHHLPGSRARRCRACDRMTLFLALGDSDESQICIWCRANLRYELLADYLRQLDLPSLDVLELDPGSPLRGILSRARTHIRSFYRPDVVVGSVGADGAVCQDITRLSYADASLDLIVSSDVLEHVPDAHAALRESARVLRSGGAHIFTVPVRANTQRRATVENGEIVHLKAPEYHLDPLDPAGILAFWDFGLDLPAYFATEALRIGAARGPEGPSGRIVWEARKL